MPFAVANPLLQSAARKPGLVDSLVLATLCATHLVAGAVLAPVWMFAKYPDAARLLRQGLPRADQGSDYSPLYLLLNTVVGPDSLRWGQSGLGCLAIVAVYFLARRLFDRQAGLAAALLMALAAPMLLYEATLEPDLLIAVLNCVGVALLAHCVPLEPGEASRVRLARALPLGAAAGAVIGLSAATRPAAFPLLVVAVGWVVWASRGAGERRARLGVPLAAAAAGLLCAFAPPLLVRATAGGELAATMSGGVVLHMGNRPEGLGFGGQSPFLLKLLERQAGRDTMHELYRRFARAAEGEALSPGACEMYWVRKAVEFARRQPGALATLLGRKLVFFLAGPDAHDLLEVRNLDVKLRGFPLLWLDHLGLLGIIGAAVAIAQRRRAGLLLLYLFSMAGVAMAFYVISRYRLGALPALCALGGAAVSAALRGLARPKVLVPCLLASALLFAAPSVTPFIVDARRSLSRSARASSTVIGLARAVSSGDLDTATSLFVKMQSLQPFIVNTLDLRGIAFESEQLAEASSELRAASGMSSASDVFTLAVLRKRADRCEDVLERVRGLGAGGYRTSVYDRSLDSALLEADCLLSRGDREGAFAKVTLSLERRPGTLDALAAAIAASKAVPRLATGREGSWTDELFALHDPLSAHYALAQARLAWGDPVGALADADAVLEKLPESGLAEYERARALVALGRPDEAVRSYARALAWFPKHAFPTRPFDTPVRDRAAANPDDPEVVVLAIEHEIRAGRLGAARQLAGRSSLLPDPTGALSRQAGYLAKARSSTGGAIP